MWGKRNRMAFSNTHTVIAGGVEIIGDVRFKGALHIEGKICGNIKADEESGGKVTVAEKGMVEGEIYAPDIVVNGRIKGNIYSGKHVELAAKAEIEGNIHYHMIEMVKGAQINGSLIYSGVTSRKSKKPEGSHIHPNNHKGNNVKLVDAATKESGASDAVKTA